MSKLLQIEQKILSLNQSAFQKLCAAYLKYLYPKDKVKEIGGSHGQDTTTTGTPDIRIDLQNGNYIFVECTIQKKGILGKFQGDVKNCFNINKSGVEVGKIEKIILCHNTKSLEEKDKNVLQKLCSEKNCCLEFIDIDDLKFDLFKQYRILAKDFLNVEADTLQILKIDDFINESQRRATSLTNKFFGRENELKKIIHFLPKQDSNIVIVTGKPGVGKTRLVLQAFNEFKEKNEDYEIIGIHNKGVELYPDLQSNFLPNKKYLLLVDDANRLNEFSHIARLVDNYNIKIAITVRDYALDKITKYLSSEKYPYERIDIDKLSDDAVRQILASLEITHYRCIDSITRIADGNPRLVLMSANFALKENDCNTLNNVTDIYDKYFEKSIDELSDLKDILILKVLGIICFFRVISKENKSQIETIFKSFKIDENDFWEKSVVLHKLELVDMDIDKSIVKISDQNLSLYFFYYTFFKKGICDYSIVLDCFLEDYVGKVKENLYPILEHFGYEEIIKIIEPKIDTSLANAVNNEPFLLKFYEVFWFCKKTDLLIWLKNKIGKVSLASAQLYSFEEEKKHTSSLEHKHPYFKLLKQFSQHPDENFKFSLELIINYVINNPEITPELIKYVKSDLSFNQESYTYDYYIQKELLNYLFSKLSSDTNAVFFERLIISVSKHFLKLYFEDIKSGRKRNSISILKVNLINTETIKSIRKQLWDFLFDNYDSHKLSVFNVIKSYINDSYNSILGIEARNNPNPNTTAIKQFDEFFVMNFFESKFTENDFKNVRLYFSYLNQLKKDNVDIRKYQQLTDRFTTPDYLTYQILEWNHFHRKKNNGIIERDDFIELKKNEIISYVQNYKLEDYIELFNTLLRINNSVDEGEHIQLGVWNANSIDIILEDLVEKDIELSLGFLNKIIEASNPYKLNPIILFKNIIQNPAATQRLHDKVKDNEFILKTLWQLNIVYFTPKERVSKELTRELLEIYTTIETNTNLRFDHLDKFKPYNEHIWIEVLTILINRHKDSDFEFNAPFEDFFDQYFNEIKQNLDLAKELYFYALHKKTLFRFDHENKAFKALLIADNNFMLDYLKVQFENSSRFSDYNEHQKFDFIWEFENYNSLIDTVLEFSSQQKLYLFAENFCNIFFPTSAYIDKIDLYIKNFIQTFYADEIKMRLIFNVILYTYPNKRIQYIKELISLNNELPFLEKLPLIPSNRVFVNNNFAVYYEEDKKTWKELEILFSEEIKHIELKQWAKKEQKKCDSRIHEDLKRQFTNEY